jgi:hypothetical protein
MSASRVRLRPCIRAWLVAPLAACVAHVAVALQQEPSALTWSRNVPAVIATAKETRRPILMLVEGTQTSRRRQHLYSHNDIEQRENALSDPRVAYAARLSVPVVVSRTDGAYAGMFVELGVALHTPYRILVISPEGAKLGDFLIAPNPADLARDLARTFRAYRRELFETELKAKLDDATLPAGELRAVVELIRDFCTEEAEKSLIAVLKRPQLDPAVRQVGYEALAGISTRGAVEFLIDRAAEPDKAAARAVTAALARCTPAGAEHLLKTLEEPDERERFLAAYHAAVKICEISKLKPDRFWQRDNVKAQAEEISRIKALVTQRAQEWRATRGDYR